MKTRKLVSTVIMAALFAILPLSGFAQDKTGDHSDTYYGLRLGMSQSPDQFVVGLQAHMGNIFEIGKFAPSLDLGLGNDVTVLTLNGDLYFPLFAPPKSSLRFFAAFGPTLAYYNADKWGSDTEIGVSGSIGLTSPMGSNNLYNLELKLGFGDIPDLKILFGLLI